MGSCFESTSSQNYSVISVTLESIQSIYLGSGGGVNKCSADSNNFWNSCNSVLTGQTATQLVLSSAYDYLYVSSGAVGSWYLKGGLFSCQVSSTGSISNCVQQIESTTTISGSTVMPSNIQGIALDSTNTHAYILSGNSINADYDTVPSIIICDVNSGTINNCIVTATDYTDVILTTNSLLSGISIVNNKAYIVETDDVSITTAANQASNIIKCDINSTTHHLDNCANTLSSSSYANLNNSHSITSLSLSGSNYLYISSLYATASPYILSCKIGSDGALSQANCLEKQIISTLGPASLQGLSTAWLL